jgi:hypothetical protein
MTRAREARLGAATLALTLAWVLALAWTPAGAVAQRFGPYIPDAPEDVPPEDSEEASDVPLEEPPAQESEAFGEPMPEAEAQLEEQPAEPLAAAVAAPSDAADEPESEQAAPQRGATLSFGIGAGVGTLSYVRPTSAGRQSLPRVSYPAIELALRVHLSPQRAISFEALFDYRSSVGLELRAEPLFGLSQDVAVRVQRAELSFAPVLRLGTPQHSPALILPIGFVVRTLVPELHQFGIPELVLAGPLLRAQLQWPLGESLSLRAGPEAQWMLHVDDALTRQGAGAQGFALAAELALETRVSSRVSLSLSYRQAHAFAPSGDRSYEDVERFATVFASGRW